MSRFHVNAARCALVALALTLTGSTASADDDARRKLIDQKLRLVEMLVKSPSAKSAPYGTEADSAKLLEEGQKLLATAREALAASRYDDAAAALDAALKTASAASRKQPSSFNDSAQRKQLDDQREQVGTYRAAISELTRNPHQAEAAKSVLAKIDALTAEANSLVTSSRLGDANKRLADAYKLAVEELSALRAGQEVVMSLKFDTPADEYAYEQKRFGSTEIMVGMMIDEGRADGGRRALVDRFTGEGQHMKRDAEKMAAAGDYAAAVKMMEKATGQLNRALQSMGVPVF